ncbi:ABC transporter ATP-binding protein [Sedimentibacter sp. MB31-C6]|uniref:ABC transporter ATP-binding protein n=1 Tax=Sedimentibacter sp. MB31-C6 TaxID=3109366 RepID=UPI002DDD54E0|nr:ABC transporter ATP-binding protein [Sedimentibacter sp. MB36-C1]WSI05069.1 ABC transporter ATP-binding protein [Sedimentibacter sp. MB36-C1]
MNDKESNILLDIKNLHTYFFTDNGVVKSVDKVDITLKKGSTLGIVGESGSGKSVTALSVMNLLMGTKGKVVDGSIHLDGKDILNISEEEKRKLRGSEIAMIFQEPMTSLNPVLKIGDQISEAIIQHFKVSKKEAIDRTIDMLEKISIPRAKKIINEYPFQLSGGMRQRIMIAMALVCNPKVLIADEPTTALDVTIQAQILELMNDLKKIVGTSVLFITHDLGVIAEICDEVVVMYCGRVVESGDVLSIFKNPKHPYTKGLLKSIPKLGQHVKVLDSIPGNVPNPKYMPKGCKFEPRCANAMPICSEEEPPFFNYTNGQKSRCWLCKKEYGGDK